MGHGIEPDTDIPRHQFIPGNRRAASQQRAGALSPQPSSRNRPIHPVNPAGTIQSLQKPAVLVRDSQGAKPIAGAALAIVVTADMTLTDTWIEDASIAAILMQLQAADLGLGSCWIQVRGRFGAMDEPAEDFVRETLGIPEEMGVLCILSIGHKDEERKPFDEEKMMWEKVHIGKW